MEGKILKAVSSAVEKGIETAVVTVLEVKGSSPGKEGSMMAVFSDGSILGTVGGGALEYEFIQEALKAIKENKSCEKSFELTEKGSLHMKCGGFVRAYIKVFAKREKLLIMGGGHLGAELYTLGKFLNKYVGSLHMKCGGFVRAYIKVFAKREKLLIMGGGHLGAELYTLGKFLNKYVVIFDDREEFFVRAYIKVFAKREKLLIMGGGHLGAELYTLGKFLNKYVVIFDDREEFANKERFPEADEIIFGKMKETVKNYSIDENSYIIIVTRGHENDKECLKAILDKKGAYIKVFAKREKLLIMGGGHLGAELYTLGKFLNKYVVIFDDREEFANKERFPEADEIIFGKMKETVKNYSIDENSYIIIVTRGHENDKECLKAILDKKVSPKYIGMVGSRGKVLSTYKELLDEGYSKEELKKIYSPIGLDISSSEPKEIALGIMAEITAVKNQKTGEHMRDVRKIDIDNLN